MIKRALISVFNKEGVVRLAKFLDSKGVEILSTGGTKKAIAQAGIKVRDVSEYTGFPEMMDGRVKTLHPKIHGGLLALRENDAHLMQAKENDISLIDLVVVNLYPFLETVKTNKSFEETIEMIDIGGPSMIRSAAKNFKDVLVVVDPKDYTEIIDRITDDNLDNQFRKRLAKKVFTTTCCYDKEIMDYLSEEDNFPDKFVEVYDKKQSMRYGENPYQDAAFYASKDQIEPSVASADVLQGKALSYNNIMDSDAALEIVKEFKEPCCAVIKHANPSGVSVADSIEVALKNAYEADSLSAYGCIIALNRACDSKCASFIKEKFVEVVIAQDFSKKALEILAAKKNLRLLKISNLYMCYGPECKHDMLTTKKVVGGLLVQSRNFPELDLDKVKVIKNPTPTKDDISKLTEEAKKGTLHELICVTQKEPTKDELKDMVFAMKVCKHVKSNSVLFAKGLTTLGIGAGQMSRVDSSMIAARKSGEKAKGAVMVSDAFFPFRDGIDEAAKSGISAVIQPGGSIRDKEAIDAANEHGISMVFTGTRLFLH